MEDAEEKLSSMTVAELKELAREKGISLKGIKKKREITAAILESTSSSELFNQQSAAERMTEDLDDVEESINEIMADTQEAIAIVESDRLVDEEKISEKLEDARNSMLDFNTLLQYLETLPKTFDKKDYALALYQVMAAERISERVFSGWYSWTVAWIISASEKMIEELESTGYDMKEQRHLMKIAKRAFGDGLQESMRESALALQKSVSAAFEGRMSDVDERLTMLEGEIAKISEIGANISDASQLLVSARNMLLKYDHLGAEKRIFEAESSIEMAKTERIQQINDYFPRVESLIEDGRSLGADMSEAEHLLKLARESFSREDYLMTSELLGKAEAGALEGQEEQIKKAMNLRRTQIAKATEIINYNEPFVREAVAYGLDIGQSSESIRQAKTALSRDDYVEGLRLANELKRFVAGLKPEIMEIRARRGITVPEKGICSKCGSDKLAFSDNGTGVCEACGYGFIWLRLQPIARAPAPPQSAPSSSTVPAGNTAMNTCPQCGTTLNFVEGVGMVCPNCGFTRAVTVKKKAAKKRSIFH